MTRKKSVEIPPAVLDVSALQHLLDTSFDDVPRPYRIVAVTDLGVTMRLDADQVVIRPGGTVSGPTMMMLADAAAWMATMSRIGPVLLAVTSNLSIDFLRKPAPGPMLAEARLLHLGRRQSVSTVQLHSLDTGSLVTHATVTYAIPSSQAAGEGRAEPPR